MPNYQTSKIYKIINDDLPDLIYIGSTTQNLCNRMKGHRQKKSTSRILFDIGKPNIILIKKFPCDSKKELHAEERKYIESMDCINKYIPTRTMKEYREDHKEKLQEYDKNVYQNNKEKKKKDRRNHYEKTKHIQNEKITCGCGGSYFKRDKNRHLKTQKHINFLN